MDTIQFDRRKLRAFKRIYNDTADGGVFIFEGKEVLKSYAKYLIEYVEMQLGVKEHD
jgi:hypothetical protein